MHIHVLQHHIDEGPGLIAQWALVRHHFLHIHHVNANTHFSTLPMADLLVVLGGPMSVNHPDPWLAHERDHIAAHLRHHRPIIGICLGAQQIAKVLGAKVEANTHREAGWYPIHATAEAPNWLPQSMTVLHWHDEVFELPQGANRLFASDVTPNQGFLYQDRALALQCHLEVTATDVAKLVTSDAAYLDGREHTQTAQDITEFAVPSQNKEVMYRLLDHITPSVPAGA